MLKKIPISLTPELYSILYQMGHGDELVIADANFPAFSNAKLVYSAPDINTTDMLKLVLSYLPIDTFVKTPIAFMQVAEGDDYFPETWNEFERLILESENRTVSIEKLDRNSFYKRTQSAYAVILTGEKRRYGNIIIKKGVVEE